MLELYMAIKRTHWRDYFLIFELGIFVNALPRCIYGGGLHRGALVSSRPAHTQMNACALTST